MPCLVRLLLIVVLSFTTPRVFSGELKVGGAWVDITPQNGTPMASYYKFRAAGEVLDPIYAKTIVVGPPTRGEAGSGEKLVETAIALLQEVAGK